MRGASPTIVADVGPVLVTAPSLGLTAIWYSAMPVSSLDASHAIPICDALTLVTRSSGGVDGGLRSAFVVTTARSLVDLLPLGSIASTQR